MKTVFIFGAGASKDCGAPLVNEFLDKARRFYSLREPGVVEDAEAFEDVFKAVAELRTVHDKSYLDLDNIEDLFATVETALLIRKFADRSLPEIENLRASLIKLIVRTLELSVKFPAPNNELAFPPAYDRFLSMLRDTISEAPPSDPHSFVFITFNYDLIFDVLFTFGGFPYDYCLDDSKSSQASPFLKLHGSVTWGFCEKCHRIIPYNLQELKGAHPVFRPPVRFSLGTNLKKIKCYGCVQPLAGPPMLVPPTWNKTQYQAQIANVWRRAALELGQAQNIIVIGYSMPDTDAFFHYLYALGSESSVKLRHFLVVNPDRSLEPRFRKLLGPGIQKQFEFLEQDFSSSIPRIFELLRQ